MASSLSISMTQENTTHLQIGRGMGLVQDVRGGGGESGICYTTYSIVVVPYFFTYKPISATSRDPESQGLSTRLRLPKKKSKTIGYKPRAKLLIVTGHLSKRTSQKT